MRTTSLLARTLAVATVALLLVPASSADLGVTVEDNDEGIDIYVEGASSLQAPQNMTITATGRHFRLAWEPPSALATEVAGYTIYRVPADGDGQAIEVHLGPQHTTVVDYWAAGRDYVYFVTATLSTIGGHAETVPSMPVSTADVASLGPHCGVVTIYTSPPYYDVHLSCLFAT